MWVTRTVKAPAARAWRVLVDTSTWTSWGPSIAEVSHDGRFIGPGSAGRIRPVVGPWLDFRVTQFDEGRLWTWTVAGVPATGHWVQSLDAERCRVGIDVPFLAAPYATVCLWALHRIDNLARSTPTPTRPLPPVL